MSGVSDRRAVVVRSQEVVEPMAESSVASRDPQISLQRGLKTVCRIVTAHVPFVLTFALRPVVISGTFISTHLHSDSVEGSR